MAMGLKVPCSVFMVLLAFAAGDDVAAVVEDDVTTVVEDDVTTCTEASSCAAWKALVDGPAKVVIQDDTVAGDVQYYRISVTHGDTGASFSKLRRYSEFANLRNSLGLDDAAQDLAPFPPKLYLNSIVQALWPQTLQDRSAQLEVWLQAVVAHENSKGPWADELFAFLDPKHSASALISGISMPPDANKICRTLTWPVTSDKHYFGIDVNNGADKPDRVWRRYNDFHALNETLGTLGAKDDDFAVAFPEKLYWNRLIPMWEGKLEERRRSLEAWLRQVKLHPNSAPGGVWFEEMNKFLDPAENEKLDKDCFLEAAAQATYSEMEKFYAQMKEKIDELTKEKIDEDEL